MSGQRWQKVLVLGALFVERFASGSSIDTLFAMNRSGEKAKSGSKTSFQLSMSLYIIWSMNLFQANIGLK